MPHKILGTLLLAAACLLTACASTGRDSPVPVTPGPSYRLPESVKPAVASQPEIRLPAEAPVAPPTSARSAAVQQGRPETGADTGDAGAKEAREKQPSAGEENPRPVQVAAPDPEANVYFASGGSQIDEPGKTLLRRHAARLKDNPDLVVTLIGYTDPTGSRSYNLAVAEERIAAVAHALRALGVPRWQIRRVNSGRGDALNTCQSAACRTRMRRVELVFSE